MRTIMGQILTSFRWGPMPPGPPVGCATDNSALSDFTSLICQKCNLQLSLHYVLITVHRTEL